MVVRTVWHHVALRLLRHFEIPDCDTSVAVAADELLAFVVPTYRAQRLHAREQINTNYLHYKDRTV